MREIKFRLRDRRNNFVGYEKWYSGSWHLYHPDDNNTNDGYWEASPSWLYSIDNIHWVPVLIPHSNKDAYTGPHDRNGKEIYEGDRVRHLKYGGVWIVAWNEQSTGYDLEMGNQSMHLGKLCEPNLEVIGNIYENPELVKS